MIEVVFLQISNQTGDYAADQALYTVEANHMSQMVIIYIIWQEMFLNGQILLMTLMHMNMFPQ
jgi:hypothetical protein